MKLNNKQLELCLHHALGQFLSGWKGTPQETWKRLQDVYQAHPETSSLEDITDAAVCDAYEHICLSELIEAIESAYFSSQQLVRNAAIIAKAEGGA